MPTVLDRTAASLFSTAVFRPVATGKSTARADTAVKQIRKSLELEGESNSAVVRAAYDIIQQEYRNEYYYKNLIASKIFIGRHKAKNSVLLNEFRIGNSIADCVLINGKGVVYEIKTEFDSPEKLETQLESYYKAFSETYVVVHAHTVERYKGILGDMPVGLLSVGTRGNISIAKSAELYSDSLDLKTMYNTLRADEITKILQRWFGAAPEVPNGLRYAKHLELAENIPVADFQAEMQRALKARTLQNAHELLFDTSMLPLRNIMVQLDPDAQQQDNLLNWLDSKEN